MRAPIPAETLDELLGSPLAVAEPQRPGVLARAWRYCPRCAREEPSVLHAEGWMCGHCLHTTAQGVRP